MPKQRTVLVALGCASLGLLVCGGLSLGLVVAMGGADERGVLPAGVAHGRQATRPGAAQRSLSDIFRPGSTPLPPVALDGGHCGDLSAGGGTSDGCVTAEIHCDDVVVGHTRGGARVFDSAFYQRAMCWPATRSWDGGDERIYRLVMPPGETHAVITLDTPCADLDLSAMRWQQPSCPGPGALVHQCEMNRWDGTRREFVEVVSQGESSWLVVVEGVGSEEGTFALQVQCYAGLSGYGKPIGR
jgi:hypothetical protein